MSCYGQYWLPIPYRRLPQEYRREQKEAKSIVFFCQRVDEMQSLELVIEVVNKLWDLIKKKKKPSGNSLKIQDWMRHAIQSDNRTIHLQINHGYSCRNDSKLEENGWCTA